MPYALPIFISACFFSHLALSQLSDDQQKTEKYVCQTDNECLERLSQALLNKKSEESFYQVCRFHHQTAKKCCANPLACSKAYAREASQSLKSASSIYLREKGSAPASCQLNNLSGLISLFLSGQSSICQAGAEHCKSHCEDKLEQFKKDFKACFSIKHPHTIDSALKQAKNPLNSQNCWREMRFIAERYKKQSLNKRALFREDIKAEDIVDCEDMGKEMGRKSMSQLALKMCHQAQAERRSEGRTEGQTEGQTEERKERERARLKAIEEHERQERQDDWQTYGIKEWKAQKERIRQDREAIFGYSSRPKKEEVKSYVRQVASEVPKTKKETEKYGVIENDKEAIKEREIVKNGEEKELVKQNEAVKGEDKKAPVKKDETAKGKDKKAPVKRLAQKKTGQNPKKAGAGLMASSAKGLKPDEPKKLSTIVKAVPAKGLKPDKLKKSASSSKTNASSSLQGSQTKPQAKTSASGNRAGGQAKPLSSPAQLAQAGDKSGKCPISMPKIKSAVVFQSVEAPQIEPLNTIKNQYDNYDLAQGKPAVILLHLTQTENIREKYSIALKVDGKPIKTKCSGKIEEKEIKEKNLKISFKERYCELTDHDLRDIKRENLKNLYHFVEILTRDKITGRAERKKITVSVEDQSHKSCSASQSFSVVIRKTSPLYLDFMTFEYNEKNKRCKGNEVSDPNIVEKFANSDEIKKYLPMMYPIREDHFFPRAVTDKKLTLFKCYNRKTKKGGSRGLSFDVSMAGVHYMISLGFKSSSYDNLPALFWSRLSLKRKLVIIVSEKYFKFHGLDKTYGLIIKPAFIEGQSVGSWNAVFVAEEALESKKAVKRLIPQGVILHELAHVLGQEKEYYAETQKNKDGEDVPLPDQRQKWFCKFPGKPREPCYKHRVFGGFQANFNLQAPWMFLNKKFPFMNNKSSLKNLWIDRKTFQKVFRTLHRIDLDPIYSRSQDAAQKSISPIQKIISPVVILSGVYDKKRGKFYKSFSMASKKGAPIVYTGKGDIEILLVERIKTKDSVRNRVLSRAKAPTDINMEILSNRGGGRVIKLDEVPILASLPVPERYFIDKKAGKNLRILVREAFYRKMKRNYVKNPYIHPVSQRNLKTGAKKRKILYNAPVDWEAKPEDLVIKTGGER